MPKFPIFQVDAFTDRVFSGNPAAVVICDSPVSEEQMQSIAAENNLSETAFLFKKKDRYQIRWFTPTLEVNLCGHATLAASHVIFHHLGEGREGNNSLIFESRSGLLSAKRKGDAIYIELPADSPKPVAEPGSQLSEALKAAPLAVYSGKEDWMAVYETEDQVLTLNPDFTILNRIPVMGVIVTAPGKNFDFVSRVFAPQSGINEDPVTGSAHSLMIPYWASVLGKKSLQAKQVSKRSGVLDCRLRNGRIELGGKAVTFLEGEISL